MVNPKCRNSLLVVKALIFLSIVIVSAEITLLVLDISLDDHDGSPMAMHEYHQYLKHVITCILFDSMVILIGGMAVWSLNLALLYAHTVLLVIYFFFRLHCTIKGPDVVSAAAWLLIIFQVIVLALIGKIIKAVLDVTGNRTPENEMHEVKVNNIPPSPLPNHEKLSP